MRALLALVALSACAGPRYWSKTDLGLEATFALADAAAVWQTREIVDQCTEANPLIGPCGDRIPLALYLPLSALVHAAITWAIPHGTARTVWLGVTAGIELDDVYANHALGF